MRIADGDHAAVCARLAAHIRCHAKLFQSSGAGNRLRCLAEMVEAAAFLPAGDYAWTVRVSPVATVTCRITEVAQAQADLALVD
jgi:hypothetical protein